MAVDLSFDDISWLSSFEPASSVRLLLPSEPGGQLELPEWNGNEFLDARGARPTIRTLTPWQLDAERGVLRVAVLRHGASPLSAWLDGSAPGDEVALSGPGRGLVPDPSIEDWVLIGDECAVPAIATLVDAIAPGCSVRVVVEAVAPTPSTVLEGLLPRHPGVSFELVEADVAAPGDSMVRRLGDVAITDSTLLWAAGEAAAMQRIRKMVDRPTAPRSLTVVRGYWKSNVAPGSAGVKPSTAP